MTGTETKMAKNLDSKIKGEKRVEKKRKKTNKNKTRRPKRYRKTRKKRLRPDFASKSRM